MKADSIEVAVELSKDGKALMEATSVHRRFGRLEVSLPEAYKTLREASDGELRGAIDRVFDRLLRMAQDRSG